VFCFCFQSRSRCSHDLAVHMARMPWLGRVLSLALIGQGTCFQLAGYPLRSTDGRGDKANGTKFAIRRTPGRVRSGRLRHVREAATAVRPDGSESGHGKDSGPDKNKRWDKRGQEAEEEAAAGSYLLMDYFIRHGIESAEIVPTVESNYSLGAVEATTRVVFVKTVIFQADGKPVAAVMREDLVADLSWIARHFRLPTRQVALAKVPFVEDVTGFPVGTIPPLGHRTRLPILVDAQLLKYSTIVGGAGLRGFDSRLSVSDLLKATGASVIPLARPRRKRDASARGVVGTTGGNGAAAA
ncbi:unnamed protein product, partial [Pylaiella littoralis]